MEFGIEAAALALLAILCVLIVRPFLTALVWSTILCFSTWPFYERVEQVTGGRRTLAALIVTLGLAAVMIAPFAIVGASLADNVADVIAAIRKAVQDGPPPPPAWLVTIPFVGDHARQFWVELSENSAARTEQASKLVQTLRPYVISGGQALGEGLLQIALSLLIAFFLYRDGAAAARRLQGAMQRVAGDRGRRLLEIAQVTIRGVVYGILGTSLLMGILAGLGYWIAKVPGAFFLGFCTFVLSVVPFGPAVIWLPAAAWLFRQQSTGWAVFIVAWGALVVGGVDNFVKPLLMSRGGNTPLILIMLGLLGGATAFGFIGIFLGPTLLAVGYSVLDEWSDTARARGASAGEAPAAGVES